MGHITSVCRLSSVHPVSNLITARSVTGVGVGSLSQSALKQEQEICFLTPSGTDLKLTQLLERKSAFLFKTSIQEQVDAMHRRDKMFFGLTRF